MKRDFESIFPDPRSEQEMCLLFNDLLFMRLGYHTSDGEHGSHLSAEGQRKLVASNVVNRIFRSWYQTNWGNTDWHDDFAGHTPRQELSAYRPDIGTGDALLSILLEEKILSPLSGDGTGGMQVGAMMHLFTRSELDSAGGAFLYGLHELVKNERGIVAPNHDPDFHRFAKHMQRIKEMAESLPSYALGDMPLEVIYWRLFIEQAVVGLIAFLPLSLDEEQRSRLHTDLVTILMSAIGLQKDGEYEYILIDTLFGYFWQAISRYDRVLLPYSEMLARRTEDVGAMMKDAGAAHSQAMLYRLGFAFDEHFLFPADSYFGAVEIVWQDKMTFMNNLAMAYHLVNHDQSSEDMSTEANSERYEMFGIQHTAHTLDTMWFNPPTCFRVFDKALTIV